MVDSSQQNNNEVSMPKTSKKNVDNKMGRWGATSYIVGNIVGAGIFVSPTSITNQVNSVGMSLAIWVLSAAICTMGGFCYLELGNSVNQSGGDFAYLCFVKWRCIAFAFMATGCILVYPMQLAIAAGAAGDYLFQSFGGELGGQMHENAFWLRKLLGFCIVWPILFLNFFSVRRVVAPFQIASSISKLIACGLIIGAGIYLIIFRGHTQNFHRPFQNSTWEAGHITNALFAGFYSYDGWDILNWGNEEIHDPKRTMSFAMLGGMGCVTLLYTAMNVAYFAVLTPEEMRSTDAVAMSFAENLIGPATAQWTIPLLINLVLLGSINGTMFIASRYLFAAAREGQLPSFLACINERNESPRAALFVHVLLAFLFSFFGNTDQLITSMGFAQWLQRCFTMAALLYIRLSDLPIHSNSMRTPLLLPLLFMAICIGLVFITVFQEFSNASIGLIVLAVAGLAYPIFLWEKGLPRFEPYRKWANWLNDSSCRFTQIVFDGRIDLIGGGNVPNNKNI